VGREVLDPTITHQRHITAIIITAVIIEVRRQTRNSPSGRRMQHWPLRKPNSNYWFVFDGFNFMNILYLTKLLCRTFPQPTVDTPSSGIKFPDFKTSGVFLRSQRMKLPPSVGQKKSKAIEQMLTELGLGKTNFFTLSIFLLSKQ